jgi:hypothetical protein
MKTLKAVLVLLLVQPVVGRAEPVPANAETGVFKSPDGRFCVEVYRGLGECNYLQLYPASSPPDGTSHHGILRFPQADVWGVLWVPGHTHLLVFGEAGITGRLCVGTWNGGPKVARLVSAPDDDEIYELKAVSADGKTAFYDDVLSSKWGKRIVHKKVRIP